MPALPLAVVVAALVSAAMLGACKDREPAIAPAAPAEQIAAAANPPVAKPALSFDEALKQAQAQQLPLLVDFHAPWCYSCYYMATNVLNGAEWQALTQRALGCERAYELGRYLEFASVAPDAAARLSAQRPAIERLLADGVFGATPCADQRSVVLVAADLYAAQTDRAAQQAMLQRAIGEVAKQIGDDLRKDRNLSDNLRVYTDQLAALTGDYAALDALMPKLIAAWPGDYVYASRYGRSLLARGRAAEALPYLEQAAQQAYGINRLKVAQERVQALQALDRGAEARVVVAEALKANGPWFPEEAAKLKALLQG